MNEYDGNDPHDVATHTSLTTAMSLNIDVYSESSSMFDNNSSTMSVDAHTVEPGHLHLSSTVRLYDISGENIVNISNFIHGRVQMAGTSKMLSALSYFKIWKKSPEQLLYHDQEQEEGFVLRDLKPVNGCLRLGHEYHINPKLLGAGTFGRVYSATQLNSTDKKFVLKVVPVERFREEEIKFAHMYPHEHLYKPYGMTWKKNTVHFFCELIQGGTLEHLVERTGPLRDDEVLYVLKTLLQYLEYWHCFGVVHRDIKPSNIMVSNDGSFLKVIDCGASGQLIDSQERTSLHGTECYMSPEMCRQEAWQKKETEHFEEILNKLPPSTLPDIAPTEDLLEVDTNPPMNAEIQAIKILKSGKAAAPNGIPPKALKTNTPTSAEMLLLLFQKVWEQEQVPGEGKKGYLVKLPKKGTSVVWQLARHHTHISPQQDPDQNYARQTDESTGQETARRTSRLPQR
ncbi:hypothetical protein ScPMuIL_000268 [Solemya velum]